MIRTDRCRRRDEQKLVLELLNTKPALPAGAGEKAPAGPAAPDLGRFETNLARSEPL